MKSLHISLNTAHSTNQALPYHLPHIHSKSSYSSHLISSLSPLPFYRSSPNYQHSRCPTYLNLPRLTRFATLCTPKQLYKSTLSFLTFSDTLHIHLTIIRSVLSRVQTMSIFFLHRPGFSPICQHTLDTSPVGPVYLSRYVV